MPLWFLVALAGHLANGAAFVIDKSLLQKTFKRPATYVGLIGSLSIVVVALFPFGVTMPTFTGMIWMACSGIAFSISLWLFFFALSKGEASRVVPVVGSLIPLFTLAGTAAFLNERLSLTQFVGFAFLLVATIILSGGGKAPLSSTTIRMAVCAAMLFAAASVFGKLAYDAFGFLTTFTWSRLWGVAAALAILATDRVAVAEVHAALGFSERTTSRKQPASAFALVLFGQALGSMGFVGIQYATALGSAAIVNALQAVQYAFLVIIALVLRDRAATLLGEDLTPRTLMRKIMGIILVGFGLWLVV
jgi:drug/metabolite transporter (DMT)-like permease